jgi:hypothetical protein
MTNPFDLALDAVIPPPKPAAKASTGPAAAKTEEPVSEERAEALAKFQARVDSVVDGIYFGLPAEVYHAIPRLSASGLQKLCVSPATFWRGSWLDPDRPEPDEDSTKAQVLGKAYHTARLEPELFDVLYVRQPTKADFPKGTLFTATDMSKALEELGLKKSGSVAEQAERLVEAGYDGPIWHVAMAEWEEQRNGRTPIPAEYFDQITTDMERIHGNGDIAPLLTGGEPEVSIFWTDEHGLQMKCRVDYLTFNWWVDFKTFDNSRGKELAQAIFDAFRYNRYYVQGVTYRDGVEAIRTGGLQIQGDATDDQRKLVAQIQTKPGELECWYVFQEKGGVPNLLAYEFPFFDVPVTSRLNEIGASDEALAAGREGVRRSTLLHGKARTEIKRAKEQFYLYAQAYDPGKPWFPLQARGRFEDYEFNSFWLEGRA